MKIDKAKNKSYFLLSMDFAVLVVAYVFVMAVESRFFTKLNFWEVLGPKDLAILLMSYTLFFTIFAIPKIIWRYAGMRDLTRVIVACFVSDILYTFLSVVVLKNYDRAIFTLLIAVVSPLFLICSRIGYRYFINRDNVFVSGKKNLAIIGAGNSGASVLKNFGSLYRNEYQEVYLFDDDPLKIGRKIAGHTVKGDIESLPKKCKELFIDEILIAIPSASSEQMNRIVDVCLRSNRKFFTLPTLKAVNKINPRDYIKHIRKVEPADLLGREEIKINDRRVKEFIYGKTIMVTGGGGSIGSELCRQIADLEPSHLIILDNYENNAYEIQQELKIKYGKELELTVEIATIRETTKVDYIFQKYRPQIVFHAAAHKHVPLMESNPEEAIKNNIFGTKNLIDAADKYGTEKFILISSDKAVNPTNIMGATKRVCEMMVQSMRGKSRTVFSAVRFGNVLGSNGSVIPLFKKQIEHGGPVTITDKRMIRYFMTIPEAVSLVMEAAYFSIGGDIFVLDMGQPVKIDDFARRLIKLMGHEPDVDIKIKYTGLRPGEKLYEELLINRENCFSTDNEKIYKEKMSDINPEFIDLALKQLEECIKTNEIPTIMDAMKTIVKSYIHSDEIAISENENIKKVMKERLSGQEKTAI